MVIVANILYSHTTSRINKNVCMCKNNRQSLFLIFSNKHENRGLLWWIFSNVNKVVLTVPGQPPHIN